MIVGGTDGSGTRGVVALLERMGVGVVYDDPVSKDVHAAEVGGWPAIVAPLVRASASRWAATNRHDPRFGDATRTPPSALNCSAPIDE